MGGTQRRSIPRDPDRQGRWVHPPLDGIADHRNGRPAPTGQKGLVIAAIDLAALGDAVRWEPSRNGQLFPHVYGHLIHQSVIASCLLERYPNRTVRLPTPLSHRLE